MRRQPQECPLRRPSMEGTDERSCCDLLRRLTGIDHHQWIAVDEATCQACCQSFLPTETDWNPIIASCVYQIGDRLQQVGGHPQCDLTAAAALCESALERLPVVLPDEDDCVDDVQDDQVAITIDLHRLRQILRPPESGGGQRRWAVAVTTAARRQPTLGRCLESLAACGWSNAELFVDGQVDLTPEQQMMVTCRREEAIGAWPAWIDTLRRLVDQDADVMMMVQDDTLFPRIECLRQYIESMLWPNDRSSLVSLYTCSDDMSALNLWRPYPRRWQYGALAMLLPRELAIELIAATDRGELEIVCGSAGIDTRIGIWAERSGVSVWHPSPSLVQHIGQISSVWSQSRAVGLRRASRFIAAELDEGLSQRQTGG